MVLPKSCGTTPRFKTGGSADKRDSVGTARLDFSEDLQTYPILEGILGHRFVGETFFNIKIQLSSTRGVLERSQKQMPAPCAQRDDDRKPTK